MNKYLHLLLKQMQARTLKKKNHNKKKQIGLRVLVFFAGQTERNVASVQRFLRGNQRLNIRCAALGSIRLHS